MSKLGPTTLGVLNRLSENRRDHADSLERLSSGQIFTKNKPRPTDRAIADRLEQKLRSIGSAKQSMGEAVSLIQHADAGLSETSNLVIRMKEIAIAAASDTTDARERRLLLVEYDALHKEVDRIASSTEHRGLKLLHGSQGSNNKDSLTLRLGDPHYSELSKNAGGDLNTIEIKNFGEIDVSTNKLKLRSASELLEDDDPITSEDIKELLEPEDSRQSTVFDEALSKITGHRATFGAAHSRIDHARRLNEVMKENVAAAKSHIADTDYASEMANLTKSAIMMQANTALHAQSNFREEIGLRLVQGLNH